MKKIRHFFSAVAEGKNTYRSTLDLSDARVDREKGIIKGVSLISEGEARGHKQWADSKTLDQVLTCAKEYTGGLRVRFNPDTFDHGPGSLAGRIPGESMRIKGKQVTGDLHIYESYAHRDYIFEIAETAPDNFGLSIEFNGVPEELEGKHFARCDEIFAATIVDIPAANATGLFRTKGDDENDGEPTMKPEEIKKLFADSLTEGLAPITKQLNELRAKVDNPATGAASAEEKAAAGVTDKDTEDVAQEKISAYRLLQKKDKPATVGDLMQMFRMTGGRPAKVSGDGEGAGEDEADKGKGTLTGFKARVKRYQAAGMPEAKAIMRARDDDKKGYNRFAAATGEGDDKDAKKD